MKLFDAAYSRREVLKIATSTALVTALSSLSVGCSPGDADLDTIARKMTGMLYHPEKAREIAAVYLAKSPSDKPTSYEQFTRELLSVLKLNPDDISVKTLNTFDTRLRAQVQQDFVDENVVIVDSWMLSRTELMLCVLAAAYA